MTEVLPIVSVKLNQWYFARVYAKDERKAINFDLFTMPEDFDNPDYIPAETDFNKEDEGLATHILRIEFRNIASITHLIERLNNVKNELLKDD